MGAPKPTLTPQLVGLEGCQVRVVDGSGRARRFWVGLDAAGARHLEVKLRRSTRGIPAAPQYRQVELIDRGPRR